MNIQESIKILKELKKNEWGELENCSAYAIEAIEILLTAYEKEKEEHKKECHNCDEYTARLGELETENRMLKSELEKQSKEIEELKDKNKKIDEFCRKELAFERRLQRENREPDEFNQGRFYVSENIRKIIKEE